MAGESILVVDDEPIDVDRLPLLIRDLIARPGRAS
jgi:hypothetical protein